MLRRYETIFITRADLQSDEMGNLIDRYTGIITDMDGKIIKVENWGKRRLAYPIEKRREGVYVRIDFAAQYKVVTEAERNFKIDDNVLRFQTVKLSDKVDLEEIEREIADTLKKEEELEKEKQRKEELKKEEELKKKEPVSEAIAEEPGKGEVISEPAVSEAVAEEPDSKEVETDDEKVVQETSSAKTDEKKVEEE